MRQLSTRQADRQPGHDPSRRSEQSQAVSSLRGNHKLRYDGLAADIYFLRRGRGPGFMNKIEIQDPKVTSKIIA